MMGNHFHLLLRVPKHLELSDAQVLERLEGFYGKKGTLAVLARQSIEQRGSLDSILRQSLVERMGDVSAFMKEFKQRFSRIRPVNPIYSKPAAWVRWGHEATATKC